MGLWHWVMEVHWRRKPRTPRFTSAFRTNWLWVVALTAIGLVCTPSAAVASAQEWVALEIRYRAEEAGEVLLVWGVDGWNSVPATVWPQGTTLEKGVMRTSMRRQGSVFSTTVRAARGTTVTFGFLITRTRGGTRISAWETDGKHPFERKARVDDVTEIRSQMTLAQLGQALTPGLVAWQIALGLGLIVGLGGTLLRSPAVEYSWRPRAILLGLTAVALALRLWVAWSTNQLVPDTAARLVGDEPGYDYLAVELLRGSFFQWPARTPVYPMFLAACYAVFGHSYASVLYVQAFTAASSVPLTHAIGSRLLGTRVGLLAAGLVAMHPVLVLQATRLYTEAVFTPLLLLAILALLWAREQPSWTRLAPVGALLGVATLTRPTAVFLPVIAMCLLPRGADVRRRLAAVAACAIGAAAVITPWTYHNYRTYNAFLPLSVSNGFVWLSSPEFYRVMQQGRSVVDTYQRELDPKANGGHDPYTIAGDRYFTKRAIASILAEPGVYAWYSIKKIAYLWVGNPAIDWPDYSMFKAESLLLYYRASHVVGVYASRLFPLIALVALLCIRRHWRALAPLLAVVGYFTLFHALTYADFRYSEPLHPILAIFVAAASAEVIRRPPTASPQ